MPIRFHDRAHAGRLLAQRLSAYAGQPDVLVLALPRGGVAVGAVVASALHVPLDVFVVRKLGLPGYEELAVGAIASGDVRVLNDELVDGLQLSRELIDRLAATQLQELRRRERAYRGGRPPIAARGRTLIVVDDGLATGSTMRVAVRALRRQSPRAIVVAVPVAPPQTIELLRAEVDDIVCVSTPEEFDGIGLWYEHFPQLSDAEVRALLAGEQTMKAPVKPGAPESREQ